MAWAADGFKRPLICPRDAKQQYAELLPSITSDIAGSNLAFTQLAAQTLDELQFAPATGLALCDECPA